MVRAKKAAATFEPDEVVVATDSIITAMKDGTEVVIGIGQKFRGGSPVVLEHPEWFVKFGTPESEWTNPARQRETERLDEVPPAPEPTPPPRRYRAVKGYKSLGSARVARGFEPAMIWVGKGDVLSESDPLYHLVPEDVRAEIFEEVTE